MKEGKCIMGEMRKDREEKPYKADEDYIKLLEKAAKDSKEAWKKEHKLRQEAETETILVKGIGMNSPEMRDAKEKIKELQSNLDRIKKENNDLYNRIAELKEAELAAHTLKKARESGL